MSFVSQGRLHFWGSTDLGMHCSITSRKAAFNFSQLCCTLVGSRISSHSRSYKSSFARSKSANLYLHMVLHGWETVGTLQCFMSRKSPRWSELESCGMVEQLEKKCMLDTKIKSISEQWLSVVKWVGESTTCVSEKLLMTLQIWEDEKLDSQKKFALKSPTRIKLEKSDWSIVSNASHKLSKTSQWEEGGL